PIRKESGDSLGFASCVSLPAAGAVSGVLLCRATSSTCGALATSFEVSSASACFKLSMRCFCSAIFCCCWASCCCCCDMASRKAFRSSSTDVALELLVFCVLAWAKSNAGANTTKQTFHIHLMEASLLAVASLQLPGKTVHSPTSRPGDCNLAARHYA